MNEQYKRYYEAFDIEKNSLLAGRWYIGGCIPTYQFLEEKLSKIENPIIKISKHNAVRLANQIVHNSLKNLTPDQSFCIGQLKNSELYNYLMKIDIENKVYNMYNQLIPMDFNCPNGLIILGDEKGNDEFYIMVADCYNAHTYE